MKFEALSAEKRAEIVAALREGKGVRETARDAGVSPATVDRVKKNLTGETAPANDRPRTAKELLEQLAARNELLQARNDRLTAEVSQLRAETETQGVAGEDVAGRVAIARFRRQTWERLAEATMRLPFTVRRVGWGRTRLLAIAELLPDLNTLMLARPHSKEEAEFRRFVKHFITDPAKLAVLVRPTSEGEAMRGLFLEMAALYIYEPAIAKLFERSVETPWFPPGMMGEG